jgi:hypothetical protein
MRVLRFLAPVVAAAAVALAAGLARASIDVELPAKTKVRTAILPAGEVETFRLNVAAGTLLDVTATPKRKSGLVLTAELRDESDAVVDLGAGAVANGRVKARKVALASSGTYTLRLSGSGTGEYTLTIAAKPPVPGPRGKTLKLDLRGVVLGTPAGGEVAVGRLVDAAGGTVAVGDQDSDLDGVVVTVPADAFATPTLVTIRSARVPVAPTDDARQASGPAVELGPSGKTFGQPVTVTLPFDITQVPADADPADLRVLVVEKNGTSFTVVPTSVDALGGTVTLSATGFSVCIPISVPGVARVGLTPGGAEYWLLEQNASMETSPTDDSRGRAFDMSVGEVSLFGDGTFEYSQEERLISWSDASVANTFSTTAEAAAGDGTYTYGADGRTIRFDTGEPQPLVAYATRDARYMVAREAHVGDPEVSNLLFLRKPSEAPPVSSLKGKWNALGQEISFENVQSSGPLGLGFSRFTGTMTFDGEGGFKFTDVGRHFDFDGGSASFVASGDTEAGAGTYTAEPDGTFKLTFPPDEPGGSADTLRAFPAEGLDVLFVVDDQPCGSCTMFFVLVRQSSGFAASRISGEYRGATMEFQPELLGGGAPTAPDAQMHDQLVRLEFGPGSAFNIELDEHDVIRNGSVAGGIEVVDAPAQGTGKWSVTKSGGIKIAVTGANDADAGFLVPAADFGVIGTRVASPTDDFMFGFLLKPPPAKN